MSAAPEQSHKDWPARYLGELATQRQLSPNTVAAYRRDLLELATLAGHDDWPRLTHHDIRRFAAKLHGGGQSARCLLYTSPSPRDRQKSRMPSSA